MTTHPCAADFKSNGSKLQLEVGMKHSEINFRKASTGVSREDAERAWFASLLWRAFPNARSENDLAQSAAKVLTRKKAPVSPRQVRNWLRGESCAKLPHVMAVLAVAGAEIVFTKIEGRIDG